MIGGEKVRLDLAVSPGTWLIPSNLLLNTQITVGYNNSLRKASSDMKLGVKISVNLEMTSVGVRRMKGAHQRSKGRPLKPLATPRGSRPRRGLPRFGTLQI